MKNVRMALALAAAICATTAASAQASTHFIAERGESESGVFALKGASGTQSVQTFTLGGLEVECSALAHGSVSAPAPTMGMSVAFKNCTTQVSTGADTDLPVKATVGPLELEYFAAGGVQMLAPVTVEVKALRCSFVVTELEEEGYLVPGDASYGNETDSTTKLKQFPSGFQHKLRTKAAIELSAVETGPCGSTGSTPEAGFYEGNMAVEATDGNLGIEREEVPPGGWDIGTNKVT